jgi:hypothetical protein
MLAVNIWAGVIISSIRKRFKMAKSQWHRFYKAKVAAQPAVFFELLADMPN